MTKVTGGRSQLVRLAVRLGNCIELLAAMEPETQDLIVTSPPYNVSKQYGSSNDSMTLADYEAFIWEVFTGLFAVTKPGGRACINVLFTGNFAGKGMVFYPTLFTRAAQQAGWSFRDFAIWVKTRKAGDPNNFSGSSTRWGSWLSPSCPYMRCYSEAILVFEKGSKKLLHKGVTDLTRAAFLEYTKNVWYFPAETQRRNHPASFPVELPRRLLQLYSYVGDSVLDPFLGTGTTGVACVQLHRNFTGFEIDPTYADEATKRIHLEESTVRIPASRKESIHDRPSKTHRKVN